MRTLLLFLLFPILIIAQDDFWVGTLLDSTYYKDSPIKAPLMRGDYNNLPPAHSIKKYAPTPLSQGQKGTCAGWSSAYAARTILEAIINNYEGEKINEIAYSPSFVYNQLANDSSCQNGISLNQALSLIQNKGSLSMSKFAYDCERKVNLNDSVEALDHRIIEYREIGSYSTGNQVLFVKKSISENKPVVIAFDTPVSFSKAKELWTPDTSDMKFWGRGHGLAVVGYDDKKFGGAIELMNSWGTQWGKGGFTWVRYSDFEFFCRWAYELIDKSADASTRPDLSGSITFSETNNSPIISTFNGEYFKFDKPYYSGSLFNIIISNEQPAYVYALSSDESTQTVEKIFPVGKNMSAFLPYAQNNIALPDEDTYLMLDDVKGKTYFCFLYSKEAIDIESKIAELSRRKGSFWEKLESTFGEYFISADKTNYSSLGKVSFSAFSKDGSIIPVFFEIEHK